MPHGKNTFIAFVHTQTHEIHRYSEWHRYKVTFTEWIVSHLKGIVNEKPAETQEKVPWNTIDDCERW